MHYSVHMIGKKFLKRRRRGSVAVEAVLLLPVLVLLTGLFGQYMEFSKTRIFVENAAYAAARSALAHKCPPFNSGLDLGGLIGAASCEEKPESWVDAARWALVPASPSSDFAAQRGVCPTLSAAEFTARAAGLSGDLAAAHRNRLCYAYEAGNVDVDVAWRAAGRDTYEIEASVRFKAPVVAPIGMFLADGRRGDGTRWAWTKAQVAIR